MKDLIKKALVTEVNSPKMVLTEGAQASEQKVVKKKIRLSIKK